MVYRLVLIIIIILLLISFYSQTEQLLMFLVNGNKVINFNQTFSHLGDQIFIFYYFNFIKDYVEENDIIVNFYCYKENHEQIKEFLPSKNFILHDYKPIGSNICLANMYFNDNLTFDIINFYYKKNYKTKFNIMYLSLFNQVSSKLKIPLIMNKFEYDHPNLLIEYDKLNDIYKNVDILVINSNPRSNQYNIIYSEWNKFIYKLVDLNFKVVTTLKVEGIPCTMDDGLSIFKIGVISTHSKIIIAINTGPTATIFTKYTLQYTKKIYLFDNKVTFSLPIISHKENINDIDINEIISLIKSF